MQLSLERFLPVQDILVQSLCFEFSFRQVPSLGLYLLVHVLIYTSKDNMKKPNIKSNSDDKSLHGLF